MKRLVFLLLLLVPICSYSQSIPLTKAERDTLISSFISYQKAFDDYQKAGEKVKITNLILENTLLKIFSDRGLKRDEYYIDPEVNNLVKKDEKEEK